MAIVSRVVPESIFTLAKLEVPIHIIQPWLNRLKDGSVITALSSRKGLPYGDSKWLKFSDGEAQYVEEGQAKLGSSVKVTSGTAKTFKFQKRIRFSDEVLYAAHEEQMHLLQQVLDDMVGALSRALDYGIIHAIDPRSGAKVERMMPGLDTAVTAKVNLNGSQPGYAGIDAAVQAVLANGYVPTGIALDSAYAGTFATARSGLTEQRLYPDFSLVGVSHLEGLRSAVSKTVSGVPVEKPADNPLIRAIVGEFDSIAWGVARSIRTETWDVGNPDNLYEETEDGQLIGRDLAGHNEICYGVEIEYSWGVADPNAFALVTGDVPTGSAGTGVTINAGELDITTQSLPVDVTAGTVNLGQFTETPPAAEAKEILNASEGVIPVAPAPVVKTVVAEDAPFDSPFAEETPKRNRK